MATRHEPRAAALTFRRGLLASCPPETPIAGSLQPVLPFTSLALPLKLHWRAQKRLP